jgi:hypothetical protein
VLQNLVVICLQQQQTSINKERLKPVPTSAEKVAQTHIHTADGLGGKNMWSRLFAQYSYQVLRKSRQKYTLQDSYLAK